MKRVPKSYDFTAEIRASLELECLPEEALGCDWSSIVEPSAAEISGTEIFVTLDVSPIATGGLTLACFGMSGSEICSLQMACEDNWSKVRLAIAEHLGASPTRLRMVLSDNRQVGDADLSSALVDFFFGAPCQPADDKQHLVFNELSWGSVTSFNRSPSFSDNEKHYVINGLSWASASTRASALNELSIGSDASLGGGSPLSFGGGGMCARGRCTSPAKKNHVALSELRWCSKASSSA